MLRLLMFGVLCLSYCPEWTWWAIWVLACRAAPIVRNAL